MVFKKASQTYRFVWALAACGSLLAGPVMAQSAGVHNPDRDRVQAWRNLAGGGAQSTASTSMQGGGVVPDVVGGRPARPGQWPFLVALVSKSIDSNYDAQFCGAALIDSQNVLTASHCVFGSSADSMQVLVGTQSLASGGRRIDVTRVTTHPDFLRATRAANGWLQDDVAVLRLAEPVTDIQPVALASSADEDDALVPAGTKTLVIGWGQLTFDTPGPEIFNQAVLPRDDIATCNALDLYSGNLTPLNVCAGDPQSAGKSACYGDSGGPLIARDANGKPLQIGVVSGGPSVCGDVPGYFARVGALSKWIQKQVMKP